jgi:aspartate racemase
VKVIGLIGGVSWNSTVKDYRIINGVVTTRLGDLHSSRRGCGLAGTEP